MQSNKKPRILVINPNSTASMTKSLEAMLATHVGFDQYDIGYTQPASGPPSINNDDDARESLGHCITHLEADKGFTLHDAYLVACYSDHPLVSWLRQQPSISASGKPVLGIFEASVIKSIKSLTKGKRFGIISTGIAWEGLLTDAVRRCNTHMPEQVDLEGAWGQFAGVETTGLNATELHDAPQDEVREKIKAATKRLVTNSMVGAVCLGCAGMAGMDDAVRQALREALGHEADEVAIIDGVVAGIEILGTSLSGAG